MKNQPVPASQGACKSGAGDQSRRSFLKLMGLGAPLAILAAPVLPAGQHTGGTFRNPAGPAGSLLTKPQKAIPTVTGEILPGRMGITSVHEHVPVGSNAEERERSIAFAISELKQAKALGLDTIIEVSPTRDAAALRQVSAATGVQVVCCTGSYLLKEHQLSMTVKDFESHMRREIEDGIGGTQVRPGVIKVAARGLPIKEAEKNLFIAAARIQQQYNLPICAHAVSGCAEQQQILEKAGADLRHCYFSHIEATFGWSGRSVNAQIDYLQKVVEKGSTLSFNNFGNWNHTKAEDLARILSELTRRGFDDRMVATMDLTWSFDKGDMKILWADTNADGKDRTYSYLLRKVVPWLRENGIPQKSIDKFISGNPEKLFTW